MFPMTRARFLLPFHVLRNLDLVSTTITIIISHFGRGHINDLETLHRLAQPSFYYVASHSPYLANQMHQRRAYTEPQAKPHAVTKDAAAHSEPVVMPASHESTNTGLG
jgi:hypothetical protein